MTCVRPLGIWAGFTGVGTIIAKVNVLFTRELTDQDKLLDVNNVLMGKLLEPATLQQQALSNSTKQFSNSPDLTRELVSGIMGADDAHAAMTRQALNSESTRRGILDILLNVAGLYETLQGQLESSI